MDELGAAGLQFLGNIASNAVSIDNSYKKSKKLFDHTSKVNLENSKEYAQFANQMALENAEQMGSISLQSAKAGGQSTATRVGNMSAPVASTLNPGGQTGNFASPDLMSGVVQAYQAQAELAESKARTKLLEEQANKTSAETSQILTYNDFQEMLLRGEITSKYVDIDLGKAQTKVAKAQEQSLYSQVQVAEQNIENSKVDNFVKLAQLALEGRKTDAFVNQVYASIRQKDTELDIKRQQVEGVVLQCVAAAGLMNQQTLTEEERTKLTKLQEAGQILTNARIGIDNKINSFRLRYIMPLEQQSMEESIRHQTLENDSFIIRIASDILTDFMNASANQLNAGAHVIDAIIPF